MKLYDKVDGVFIDVPDLNKMDTINVFKMGDNNIPYDPYEPWKSTSVVPKTFTIHNLGEAFERFVTPDSMFTAEELRLLSHTIRTSEMYDPKVRELADKLHTQHMNVSRFDDEYIGEIEELKSRNERLESHIDTFRLDLNNSRIDNYNYKNLFDGNIFKVLVNCIRHWRSLR